MFKNLYRDPLTGMSNLFGLLDCDIDKTFSERGTILYIDLRHLMEINRDYGIKVGDVYIRSLAEIVHEEVYNNCPNFDDVKCFRVGGDEFVIRLGGSDYPFAGKLAGAIGQELAGKMKKFGVECAGIHYAIWKYEEPIESFSFLLKKCYILLAESHSGVEFSSDLPDWADKMIERMLNRVKETLQLLQNSNKLAFSDDISQLPNHRAANLYLEEAAEDYYLYRKPYSVLFIDGDNLKRYNELGYQQGNNMIRKLGKLITDSVRCSDKVCRWFSGDEFAVILKDTEKAAAYQLAERIRKKVELETINWEYAVTISIGVAECPADGVDMESVVKKAENANTLAKRSGKNCVQG